MASPSIGPESVSATICPKRSAHSDDRRFSNTVWGIHSTSSSSWGMEQDVFAQRAVVKGGTYSISRMVACEAALVGCKGTGSATSGGASLRPSVGRKVIDTSAELLRPERLIPSPGTCCWWKLVRGVTPITISSSRSMMS